MTPDSIQQKYAQTVVSTRIVPDCVQFLGEEKHPGQAQTLVNSVASGKEGRIVARCSGAQAADGEGRIKDKGRSRSGLCLIQLAKPHQRVGEPNLRKGIVAIGLNAAP